MKKVLFSITCCFIVVFSLTLLFAISSDYEVQITRKYQNLYKVDNTDIWIQTRYCYEYSYSEKAILKYSGYGFSKGELIFKNGGKYDVEEIYEGTQVNRGTKVITRRGNIEEIEVILEPTKLR
jgi:hypothetical protein